MARFAAGVVIVTTREDDGTPRGFTASSFCSVSQDPPLVLVCLSTAADSHEAFLGCTELAVSVLRDEQRALAGLFATRGADKFAAGGFAPSPGGLPVAVGALVTLECAVRDRHPAGDHTILVAEVRGVRLEEGSPMVYYGRAFHGLV
ncbi:flavin reductase family protein [Streptomyces sp. NPDC058653]|uniref:flavin reductase family protein n=1 Tax=Streptomyces sp. NPDC058653 TaxID=3346576 RepID=UPI00364991FA